MDIKLGKSVRTADGTQIGKVDRIVLDPDNGELLELIVHEGHVLTRDRIVDRGLITDVDLDGTVYLTLTQEEAEALPPFAASEHIVPSSPDRGSTPMALGTATMTMPILWRVRPDGHGQHHVSTDQYYTAVADAAAIETRSNLPENAVAISRATEVVDVHGRKLGEVDIVLYNGGGEIKELIVRAGHRHRHELRVPRAWVEVVTHERIRLNVDARMVETENVRWATHDWSARAGPG
jgi:sporulation protein YlmC with PRC-barrel domain